MVSIRCKMVVKSELDKLGLHYSTVDLGFVDVKGDIMPDQLALLKTALSKSGLELMDDKKALLIEKIKNVVIEMVHYDDDFGKIKNSEYISRKLNLDYTFLANLFAEVTGTTLEHFIIIHKIDRVKEMMLFDGLNLTEISFELNYSSVAHLSNQFKKVTGLTPSFFRQLNIQNRNFPPIV